MYMWIIFQSFIMEVLSIPGVSVQIEPGPLAMVGETFDYTIPASTFNSTDMSPLTYTVNSTLPSWLQQQQTDEGVVFELYHLLISYDDSDVDGDLLFVAYGTYGILVYNISDINNPTHITLFPPYSGNTGSTALVVKDDYLVVGERNFGIRVLSISDVNNIEVVGEVKLPSGTQPYKVYLDGDYVYVTTMSEGIYTIDISDPTDPQEIGYLETVNSYFLYISEEEDDDLFFMGAGSNSKHLWVVNTTVKSDLQVAYSGEELPNRLLGIFKHGNYLYTCITETITIFEIKNDNYTSYQKVHDIFDCMSCSDLYVLDDILYFTCSSPREFYAYNISDPSSPQYIGDTASTECYKTTYLSNHDTFTCLPKYMIDVSSGGTPSSILITTENSPFRELSELSNDFEKVRLWNDMAFYSTFSSRIIIFDVKNRDSPTLIGYFDQALYYSNFDVDDWTLYIPRSSSGCDIYEFSYGGMGLLEFNYLATTEYAADYVQVVGNTLYCSRPDRFFIYNVTDKHDPVNYGYDIGSFTSSILQFVVVDGFMYVWTIGPPGDIGIFNVSDPFNIEYKTNHQTGAEFLHDVRVRNDVMYYCEDETLYVYDVRDKMSFNFMGSLSSLTSCRTLSVTDDDRLYIGDYDECLVVVNITDPTDPNIMTDLNLDGDCTNTVDIISVGSIVFAAQDSFLDVTPGVSILGTDNGTNLYSLTGPPSTEYCGDETVTLFVEDGSGEMFYSFDIRVRAEGYVDSNCSVYFCNEKRSDAEDVCEGFGDCYFDLENDGFCVCEKGYLNESYCTECSDGYIHLHPGVSPVCIVANWSCNGIHADDDRVCSGHGRCDYFDQDKCICEESYFGLNCSINMCFDIYGNLSDTVCSGHGDCVDLDTCHCHPNYYGGVCNITTCGGFFSNASYGGPQCYGHGICLDYEVCYCEPMTQYYGIGCNITLCDGIFSNETSLVCSGHGSCHFLDECHCYEGYYEEKCNVTECYGVVENMTESCGENGQCVEKDTCVCTNPDFYVSEDTGICEVTTCYGVMSNVTEEVCSGRGRCLETDVCSPCDDGYFGTRCNITTCTNQNLETFFSNETDHVCFGRGRCFPKDECECFVDGYSNPDCNHWQCFSVDYDVESEVCGGDGECIAPDNCSCDPFYFGERCEYFLCFNISNDLQQLTGEEEVCAGHGECVDPNVCFCESGYSPKFLNGPCVDYDCGVFHYSEEEVCSGNGRCVASQTCECDSSYEGDLCETWSCANVRKDADSTCSSHGRCVSPNECECTVLYSGNNCDTNLWVSAIVLPFVSVFSIGTLLIIFCCVSVLFCCLLLFGCISCIFFTCTLCFFLVKQRVGIKRFSKLKNFEMLLKEQMMDEDTSQVHLRINKDLFEIEFDDIKTESILGEGGSSSVVFKASWSGKTVAFKCFKTRLLMGSQNTFNEFEREVELLASISHPYIIRFFGATMKIPRVGIVMEYASNGEILDYVLRFRELSGSWYPIFQKLRMFGQISDAVSYLHSKKIIHRDIKCENVLIDDRENVKLMDFGLSKLVENMSQNKTIRIGTNIYMSPEIVSDVNYSEKCDVFSLAILFFVILTENDKPYGEGMHNIEFKVANDPRFRPDLKLLDIVFEEYGHSKKLKWVGKFLEKCWSHDPEARYSSSKINRFINEKIEVLGDPNFQDDEEEKEEEGETPREKKKSKRLKKESKRLKKQSKRLKKKSDGLEVKLQNANKELERKDKRIKELEKRIEELEKKI